MFKHLLVPIAGDELSPRAMHASVELAHKLGASITGFIAEPPAPPPPTGQRAMRYLETLEEHKRETAEHASDVMSTFEATAKEAGVPFKGVFTCVGQVDEAIAETAHRHGCDLIVMVTHGRHGLSELVYGSHTKGVLSRSKLPLLILR